MTERNHMNMSLPRLLTALAAAALLVPATAAAANYPPPSNPGKPQPRSGKARIAAPHLAHDDLRDEDFEIHAMQAPPRFRGLLIHGNLHIPAPPRDEVARAGGFKVEAGLHCAGRLSLRWSARE